MGMKKPHLIDYEYPLNSKRKVFDKNICSLHPALSMI